MTMIALDIHYSSLDLFRGSGPSLPVLQHGPPHGCRPLTGSAVPWISQGFWPFTASAATWTSTWMLALDCQCSFQDPPPLPTGMLALDIQCKFLDLIGVSQVCWLAFDCQCSLLEPHRGASPQLPVQLPRTLQWFWPLAACAASWTHTGLLAL